MNGDLNALDNQSLQSATDYDRRRFLRLAGTAGLGSAALSLPVFSLASSDTAAWGLDVLEPDQGLMLASIARLLFPHPELPDTIYRDVVSDIDNDIAARSELGPMLQDALLSLEKTAGGNWLASSVDQQIAALGSIQDGPAFFYLRNRTIESLYRNPVVWKLVGYEGSSIEYGGYLDRGFDDIDWLAP